MTCFLQVINNERPGFVIFKASETTILEGLNTLKSAFPGFDIAHWELPEEFAFQVAMANEGVGHHRREGNAKLVCIYKVDGSCETAASK